MKKQLEKTRKDAIFKAYIEKKKQMQDEIGGVIGKPQQHRSRPPPQERMKSQQRLLQTTNNHNTSDLTNDYTEYTERSNAHMSKSKWFFIFCTLVPHSVYVFYPISVCLYKSKHPFLFSMFVSLFIFFFLKQLFFF